MFFSLVYIYDVNTLYDIQHRILSALETIGGFLPTPIRTFIVHLRLHYQFFILAGGYFIGSLFVETFTPLTFWLQFLNMCILLFGGATVYNSWHDKDEGPIGGLKHPPPMQPWMRIAAIWMQFVGLLLAHWAGMAFTYLYLLSMVLFWLYSTPRARWKGNPILSLVAIGVSTGTNSFWMGYLAAGGEWITPIIGIAGVGVALVFLSLYPVSQIYQMKADSARGDHTFAIMYGVKGIKRFYVASFYTGLVLVGIPLAMHVWWIGITFLLAGSFIGNYVYGMLKNLKGTADEYQVVMNTKYLTSLAFTAFILLCMLILHGILS